MDEMVAQTLAEVRELGQVEADGWITVYQSAPVEERSGPRAPHRFVGCGCGSRTCAYCNFGMCLACGKGRPASRHVVP